MQQHFKNQLWTIRQAACLADAGIERAGQWFTCGMFESVAGGGRDGVWHRLDWSGVVAIGTITVLRNRGLSREAIRPISRYICGLGARRLLRCERAGRLLLLTSAGQQKPRLVDADSVGIAGAGGMVMAVDLSPVIAGIRGRIQENADKPAGKRTFAFPLALTTTTGA